MLETLDGQAVTNLYQELMVSSSIAASRLSRTGEHLGAAGEFTAWRRDQEINDIYGRLSRLENNQVWIIVMMITLFFMQQLLSLAIFVLGVLWPEEGRWLGSIVKAFCINRPLVALMFVVSMMTGVTICGSMFVSFLHRHITTPAAASPPTDGPVPTPGGDTSTPARRSPVSAVLAGCLGGATTDSPELFKRMAITLASGEDGNGKAAEFVRERIDRKTAEVDKVIQDGKEMMDKKTAEVDKALQVLQEVGQSTHRLNSDAQ